VSDPLSIGVDFGSTGLRVAYAVDGDLPVVLPDSAAGRWPWLLCEPAPGRLGVSFPSLKSKLGTDAAVLVNRRPARAAELAAEIFRSVRQAVESQAARPVAQAVISVPARYSASQRAALRDAALAARFAEVHLISDTVAAVMASTARREGAATVLVYGMGYAGFEVGLVRAVRGHYRALGYEGGLAPAGWALDQLLLQAVLDIARESDLPLDAAHWESPMWMQVRAFAQRVKEDLSVQSQVALPLSIQSPDGRRGARITFARAAFEEAVGPSFASTLDSARNLLDQAHLSVTDIDTILLVGGSTRIPLLQAVVERELGKPPVLAQPDDLARGAALYAARLESKPLAAGEEAERGWEGNGQGGFLSGAALRAAIEVAEAGSPQLSGEQMVLLAGGGPAQPPVPDRQAFLLHARQLAEGGKVEEARSLLTEWIRDAQALLASLPAAEHRASSGPALARRAFARARQYLEKGQLEEAIRESHYAWQQDRDNPDVFDKMIEIHCEASLARRTPAGYADAQRWLLCANQHDEGNGRVQELLAERHFLQAKHLSDHGQRNEALQTLELCLAWNPEHSGGRALQTALRRRAP
jgi:hypothetical protein